LPLVINNSPLYSLAGYTVSCADDPAVKNITVSILNIIFKFSNVYIIDYIKIIKFEFA